MKVKIVKKNITTTPRNKSGYQDFDPKKLDFSKINELTDEELKIALERQGSTETIYSHPDELDLCKTIKKIETQVQIESSSDNSDSEWKKIKKTCDENTEVINSLKKQDEVAQERRDKNSSHSDEKILTVAERTESLRQNGLNI